MNTRTYRKPYQWQVRAFLLMLLLLTLQASCSQRPAAPGTPSTTAPSSQSPSILRIGWKGTPDTLNPPMAFLTDSYTIFNLVYDTMYELQLDNSFTPSLAESVTASADGKVWTYKIHSGIRWHDGAPLTAHDIAFTYNFYHDHPEFPYLPIYTEQFASVTATDDATVVITLDAPLPNVGSQLLFIGLFPIKLEVEVTVTVHRVVRCTNFVADSDCHLDRSRNNSNILTITCNL